MNNTSTNMKSHPVFTIVARTRGQYNCSFVFENKMTFTEWQKTEFIDLQKKHGPLTLDVDKLPGLKIGDTCLCLGEGADELRIEGMKRYAPNRWAFALTHGCWEEVAKCWKKIEV